MEISRGCIIHGFQQLSATRIADASYGFVLRSFVLGDNIDSNETFLRFLEKVRCNALVPLPYPTQ